jgi:hypothetical protein
MRTAVTRAAKMALVIALLVGAIAGAYMFYVAGVHNPQQEFHGAEWSSFSAWVFVGITWFAATFVAAFGLVFLTCWVTLRFRSRSGAA